MSISVDDSGAPYPEDDPIPLEELRALSWMDVHTRYATRYPDLNLFLEDTEVDDELARFGADSICFDVPTDYIKVLRTGIPEGSYSITVGGTRVRVAVLLDRTACAPDPARENDSWQQLRDIVATTTCAGIVLDLPQELALAVWTRDGQEIWACRPGTPTGALRKVRQRRRRLTALSPLPLLGAFGQAVTSGTCAASFAFAPVLPAVPLSDSDVGTFSRPPATAAAHIQPQPALPVPGGTVRTDVFLTPAASPDYVRAEPTPTTPTGSAAPVVSAPPTVNPPTVEPSPSPSPTGGDITPSPEPSPDAATEQSVSDPPDSPEQSATPTARPGKDDARPRQHGTSGRPDHPHRHGHPRGHR